MKRNDDADDLEQAVGFGAVCDHDPRAAVQQRPQSIGFEPGDRHQKITFTGFGVRTNSFS
jgi:hypothetical protein